MKTKYSKNFTRSRVYRNFFVVAFGAIAAIFLASVVGIIALFSRSVVIPARKNWNNVRILSYNSQEKTITFEAHQDTLLPGKYSLWFSSDNGHARIGDIISRGEKTVTRSVDAVDYGRLETARRGRLGSWYFLTPHVFGYPVHDVLIETEFGQAPAWFIPAENPNEKRWAILVHGRGVRRAETNRAVPVLHDCGMNILQISYRNDADAPQSNDGRYGLGDTEWRDVDAAISYARQQGASEIFLMGWSMGGAIVLQASARSENASMIRGIILDSPVISWKNTIIFQGQSKRIPALISKTALAAIGNRWGKPLTGQSQPVDFDRLDWVSHAQELTIPMLLLHSDDDGYVPVDASRLLAEARPDLVRFVPFSVARHVRLWNYDPQKWNDAIKQWLSER